MRLVLPVFLFCLAPVWANRLVCYSGAINNQGLRSGLFLGASKCTHIVIENFVLKDTSGRGYVIGNRNLMEDGITKLHQSTAALKANYPYLIQVASIDFQSINKLLEDIQEKKKMVTDFAWNLLAFLNAGKYQGVDFHMGYPSSKDPSEYDELLKNIFSQIIVEIATVLKSVHTDEIPFSVSITAFQHFRPNHIDMEKLHLIDFITLWTAEFKNPENSYNVANFPHSLYDSYLSSPEDQNVDRVVRMWSNVPGDKLNLAIPTWGRSWKLTRKSATNGYPPLVAKGPGPPGPITRTFGLLSYGEYCRYLQGSVLKESSDSKTHQDGLLLQKNSPWSLEMFLVSRPNLQNNLEDGLWVGMETETSAKQKARYALQKGMKGVTILNMLFDDMNGDCGQPFGILSTVNNVFKIQPEAYYKSLKKKPITESRRRYSSQSPKLPFKEEITEKRRRYSSQSPKLPFKEESSGEEHLFSP